MSRKIIVNADDFGLSEGVVLGILKAHEEGILTSTTCMMNMENIEKYLEMASHYPSLGLGVHLNITLGKSLTGLLASGDGLFTSSNKTTIKNQEALYQEWKAQIDKFITLTGHKPTHLDSHHHVHLKPGNFDVALRLAREYDIPLRQTSYQQTDYEEVLFEEVFYNKTVSIDTLLKVLERKEDIFELMCHPAYIDELLYTTSSYNIPRCFELSLLVDEKIKAYYQGKLINYGDVEKKK